MAFFYYMIMKLAGGCIPYLLTVLSVVQKEKVAWQWV